MKIDKNYYLVFSRNVLIDNCFYLVAFIGLMIVLNISDLSFWQYFGILLLWVGSINYLKSSIAL